MSASNRPSSRVFVLGAVTLVALWAAAGMAFVANAMLPLSGSIQAQVTTEAMAPLQNVNVQIADAAGNWITMQPTDASGAVTFTGLDPGTYYARTQNDIGLVDEVFDNVFATCCNPVEGTPIVVADGETESIAFRLASGGRISGRITDAATTDGTPGVWVDVSDANGRFIRSTNGSDSDGNYITQFGLPAGTYTASTNNNGAFINEAFDNLPITTAAPSRTPITVTVGATTADIDFELSEGGRVSGHVEDAVTHAALQNVGISIYDPAGSQVAWVFTDTSGNYSTPGLPGGTYYAKTSRFGAYIPTLYAGIPCPNCDVRAGTPINVTTGSTAPGIDFSLAAGGQISGHITNSDGGAPIAGVPVEVADASGRFLGWESPSDASGAYITSGLPSGTYYIRTNGNHAFVNELYDNLPAGTTATSGAPVVVTAGNVTPNIDFQLAAGGRISGTVRNQGGQPLGGVGVTVFNAAGQWAGYDETDASGQYLAGALAAGSYYLRTERYGAYIRTVYPDIFYLQGSVTTGTAVPVTVGTTTPGIDFTLVVGGQISGQVTRAGAGTAIPGVATEILDSAGRALAGWETATDASGLYLSRGLPASTYYIRTNGSHGYVNEAYDNLPFTTNFTSMSPVVVTLGSVTPNIDFQLAQGGQISGKITNEDDDPVSGVTVRFFDGSNQPVGSVQTLLSGNYTSPAFLAGSYYIEARGPNPYITMVYPSTFCLSCNRTIGTAVAVTVGNTTSGIDMTLVRGGQIAGTMTDAVSALPLAGIATSLRDSAGNVPAYGWEPNSVPGGGYITRGLPSGTYYIRTEGNHSYVNEYYNNLPTGTTPWSSATPVSVTQGSVTNGINFALTQGGRISGRVTSAASGLGMGGIWVYVYDSSNNLHGTPQTSSAGDYITSGLPPGSYHLQIVNVPGYIPEAYDNIPCIGCSTSTGTPVTVNVGETTPGIDFTLEPTGRVAGTVTDAGTTLGIANVQVELLDSSGGRVGNLASTNASGQYAFNGPLLPGTYFARTWNVPGYINEVYDNLPIWTARTSGTPITVTNGATSTVNFALDPNPGPNTSETAVELSMGLTENLIFTAGAAPDVVWYKFFVPPGEAGKDLLVHLRVTSPYPDPTPSGWGSDLDFEILDSALKVRALAVSASDDEGLALHDVASGWYYIFMGYCSTNYADTNLAARYSIEVETGTDFGAGYISGRILDANGQGVEQVYIRVNAVPGNFAVSFPTLTAGPGGYFTVPVLPGYHSVWFSGENMSQHQGAINVVDEYYSNKPSQSTADTVIVTEGNTTNLGDMTLAIGAVVTGRVTNASETPLSNVVVLSMTPDGYARSTARTNVSGEYTLPGVPTGGALMRFSRNQYAQEFYDDRPTIGSATILPTQGGMTTNNVNAVMTAGGRITGTVQDMSGAPVAANVRLYSVLDQTFHRASANSSGSTGAFTFNNVKPGDYKILFANASVGFLQEWYDNAATFADAAVVTVTEGGTVSGILAQLLPAASEMDVMVGATRIASGGTHSFGPHMVNTDSDVVFTIANTGTGGLTILGPPFIVSGTDAYEFSVVSQATLPVLAGTSTTFTVRFRPTSAGPKSAYISLTNNDPNENPYVINLSGAGITERITPVITWPDPAPITFGTPLGAGQLNAQADVPGAFQYTPPAGTVLAPGNHTLSVLFTPDDTVNYSTVSDTASLTVLPLPGAFSKTSPASGAIINATSATLAWGASADATSYEYCYDTSNNSTCEATWTTSGTSTGATLSGLTPGSTYYWQVRARNAAGTTEASGGWWTFVVAARIIGLSGNLAFGSVPAQTTATRVLTISNSGTGALTVSGINYPVGFSGAWSGSIPPGGSQPVTVTFAPTAVASYGGTVTVNSDGTSGANTIAASGTGAPVGTVTISGNVRTVGGRGVAGVVMAGLPGSPSTNAAGFYTASVASGWSGTVTPSRTGWTFVPPSTAYTSVATSQTTDYVEAATGNAVYDATLNVPACAGGTAACDSGALLAGRGPLAVGGEDHQPNTLGVCPDGGQGAWQVDESIERIRVVSVDGSPLAAGGLAHVDVTVWAFSTEDVLDIFHAVDPSAPRWALVASLPVTGPGNQVLSTLAMLPGGGLQAVRAQLRYRGSAAPCSTGDLNDHDDIVFRVGGADVSVTPSSLLFGASGVVPVMLGAQGTERVVAFSVTFDPAVLAFQQAVLGSGAGTAMLDVQSGDASSGRVGLRVTRPAGQPFAVGRHEIVAVHFVAAAGPGTVMTTMGLGSDPIAQDVTSDGGGDVPAAWHDGLVAVGGIRVTGVVPERGITTGDETVTISGTGFVAGQTSVLFGAEPSRAVVVTSPTSLTAVTPPGVAGAVNVEVRAPGGDGILPQGFTYELPAADDGPDLRLTMTHTGTFAVGLPGTYTLTVTNAGTDSTTREVVVVDTLPAGLSYASSSGTGWSCTAEGVFVGCRHAGPVGPRASLPPLQLTVAVGPEAAGSVTNTARAWTAGERREWDNQASDVTVVAGENQSGRQPASRTTCARLPSRGESASRRAAAAAPVPAR
ncbi:MAG: carboxypeptidase regulatory-like domain-containing protein [Vicinamibacterales bacterium]